jgi:hypothetical protein
MTLKNRFLLIIIGLVLFALISPVLVLFARGYKFNPQGWRMVKTGSIVVKTDPQRADIFLDGEDLNKRSNTTLRFLLPKEYTLTIKKDDYLTWTKKLSVHSEKVTWSNPDRDYVTLFRSNPNAEVIEPVSYSYVEQKLGKILFLKNSEVWNVDLNSKKIENLGKHPLTESLDYSNTNRTTIFEILSNFRPLNINTAGLAQAQKVQININYTSYLKDGKLIVLDLLGQDVFSEQDVGDYLIVKGIIWFTQGSSIFKFDLATKNKSKIGEGIPKSGQIVRGGDRVFVIASKDLFLVNDSLKKFAEWVEWAFWDDGGKILLFGNSHDISIYDPERNKTELLVRTQSEVGRAQFNHATGYLFYESDGIIKAIELDGRDRRNIFDLSEAGSDFAVSSDGSVLYVITENQIIKKEIR